MGEAWDREVDVLVVGSGAAGLTAAITAASAGRTVLVVESTERWGGTTALSGGGLWMPTNPLIRRHRRDDSAEKALAYMDAVIEYTGPASSPERRRAFVEAVPVVFRLLARHGVRWALAKDYPDYYPERVGGMTGRAIEVRPFDTKRLGAWAETGRIALPLPMMTDDFWELSRAWSSAGGLARGARVAGRALAGLARGWRVR